MGTQQGEDIGVAHTADTILPVSTAQHGGEGESKHLLPRSGRDQNARRVTFQDGVASQDCEDALETSARKVWRAIRAIAIGILHVAFSAGVILFNKYTLHPKRFPYAVVLTTLQVACAFCLGKLLSKIAPGLFPSARMVLAQRKYVPNDSVGWAFLPIGFCTAVATTCANIAYLHAPVSFLQMVRAPVVVWVYLLTVMFGLERVTFRNALILGIVLITSALAVTDARPFVEAGFYLQIVSSVAQATQAVLTSRLMTRSMGLKVDPLSIMLVTSPVVLLLLLPIDVLLWDRNLTMRLLASWPLLCLNVLFAFMLQLINAITLRELSATGLSCVAAFKDAAIVALAVVLLHEGLTRTQLTSFVACVAAVAVYSLMKVHPRLFEAKAPSPEP